MPVALAFLAALAAALALTPVTGWLAHRVGALDAVGGRKIHARPTPRLGGLAIVAAFFAGLAAVAFAVGPRAFAGADPTRILALGLGGLAIAAIGLYDDLRGARARVKLLLELGVAAALYAAGFRIEAVPVPFAGPIALGALSLPVTVLWIAGVTNALNLVDGLDGLAAGVAAVAAAATGFLAARGGDLAGALAAAALGGAAFGFLRYNRHPASIFMGDAGSLFLGFVLAVSSLGLRGGAADGAGGAGGAGGPGLLASALVLGLPIADTVLAFARRALAGVPVFRPDRGHLHHKLLDRGLAPREAARALHGAAALLATAGLLLAGGGDALGAAALGAVLLAGPAALYRAGALPLRAPVVNRLARIGPTANPRQHPIAAAREPAPRPAA